MLPVEEFARQLKAEGAARRTVNFYLAPVEKFAKHCGKPLEQVTPEDVYAFRDTVTSSDYARHNAVRAVKFFLRRSGVKIEVKLPSFTPPTPDEYSQEQLKQLFSVATCAEKRLFGFFRATGCREQEVMTATWDCLTSIQFTVRAHPELGWNPKKFHGRIIPIGNSLSALLEPVRNTGLIFPNIHGRPDGHFLKKLGLLAKRSGQDPALFNLQRFRRTFATDMLRRGATVHEVAGFLGHTNLDTVLRYLSLASASSDRVRNLANGLEL